MVVGSHSKYDINICLNTLAQNNQCILGINKGNKLMLQELIDIVSSGKVSIKI